MPIPAIIAGVIPEIADGLALGGLGGGAIGGSVANWCSNHPGPGCVNKRDLFDTENIPHVNVGRDDVGPCDVPLYNFNVCQDQVKSQDKTVTSSNPSDGGKWPLHLGPTQGLRLSS